MPALYLVRHGETHFNAEQRLVRDDTGLNARGREQAAHCGEILRKLLSEDSRRPADYDYVSSPLRRARETMEVVRATLDLDPTAYAIDSRLMEIFYGNWEGLTLSEIEAREPGALAQRDREKWSFQPSGGECYRDIANRVADWYATVTRDTVVVAHGGVARVLMANLHIVSEEEAARTEVHHGVVYVFSEGRLARYE
jgi:broad specificity phosphatase PhoE